MAEEDKKMQDFEAMAETVNALAVALERLNALAEQQTETKSKGNTWNLVIILVAMGALGGTGIYSDHRSTSVLAEKLEHFEAGQLRQDMAIANNAIGVQASSNSDAEQNARLNGHESRLNYIERKLP